ncbi:MAG TPA: DUF3298/DUF4163 domain-containing protein, partial [Spirochaetia bacterium]|nr:DUF3298/DUF4163 domain-containing protein [Spirochaetia bacterium]
GDALSGYYYYQTKVAPLFLQGTIAADGSFTLTEHPRADTEEGTGPATGSFTGTFEGKGRAGGVWKSADRKKTFPFSLAESCGTDSVCFTAFQQEEQAALFPNQAESPFLEMTLALYYPVRYADRSVLEKLRRELARDFPNDPENQLAAWRDRYVNDYREANQEFFDPSLDWQFSWVYNNDVSVVCNDRNLLSLRFSLYEYSGGAHGNSYIQYNNYDLQTGALLSLTDLFSPGSNPRLLGLLERKLRAREQIPAGEPLSDHDYFVDSLPLAETWYIAPDGIGFFYNNYEIRAYAFGPVELFLSWNELGDLIKPESPVRRLIRP